MNNTMIHSDNQCKPQDNIKIGKTTYIINHIFSEKGDLPEKWLAILARNENVTVSAK